MGLMGRWASAFRTPGAEAPHAGRGGSEAASQVSATRGSLITTPWLLIPGSPSLSAGTPQGEGDASGGGLALLGSESAADAGELGSAPTTTAPMGSGRATNVLGLAQAVERYFPPDERVKALRVALCESGGDPAAVGGAGERGTFQVRPDYHGPVHETVDGQVRQAAEIYERKGWRPWTCR